MSSIDLRNMQDKTTTHMVPESRKTELAPNEH